MASDPADGLRLVHFISLASSNLQGILQKGRTNNKRVNHRRYLQKQLVMAHDTSPPQTKHQKRSVSRQKAPQAERHKHPPITGHISSFSQVTREGTTVQDSSNQPTLGGATGPAKKTSDNLRAYVESGKPAFKAHDMGLYKATMGGSNGGRSCGDCHHYPIPPPPQSNHIPIYHHPPPNGSAYPYAQWSFPNPVTTQATLPKNPTWTHPETPFHSYHQYSNSLTVSNLATSGGYYNTTLSSLTTGEFNSNSLAPACVTDCQRDADMDTVTVHVAVNYRHHQSASAESQRWAVSSGAVPASHTPGQYLHCVEHPSSRIFQRAAYVNTDHNRHEHFDTEHGIREHFNTKYSARAHLNAERRGGEVFNASLSTGEYFNTDHSGRGQLNTRLGGREHFNTEHTDSEHFSIEHSGGKHLDTEHAGKEDFNSEKGGQEHFNTEHSGVGRMDPTQVTGCNAQLNKDGQGSISKDISIPTLDATPTITSPKEEACDLLCGADMPTDLTGLLEYFRNEHMDMNDIGVVTATEHVCHATPEITISHNIIPEVTTGHDVIPTSESC